MNHDFALGDRVTLKDGNLKGVGFKAEEFKTGPDGTPGVILSGPCSTPGCGCTAYIHVPCEWVRLVMHG